MEPDNNWTVHSFLDWSVACLTGAGVDSPRLDAEVLLAGALRSRREEVRLESGRILEGQELAVSQNYIERRACREPVSYILNRREFWSMEFKVTPDVLVPRPETEVLIERILDRISARLRNPRYRVLDIGTGSGNIAVTLAKELPHSCVTAVDISPQALAVAKENALVHRVADRIHFVCGDCLSGIPMGLYNLIVSNPPYIKTAQWEGLMADVKDYEPRRALDGGAGGLEFYRRIVPGAYDCLAEGGLLALEIGEHQAKCVAGLFRKHGGYQAPDVLPDYSGRDRIVLAERL